MAYSAPTREFTKMWPSEWEVDGEDGLTMLKPVGLCEFPVESPPTISDPDPDGYCEAPAVGQVYTEFQVPGSDEWRTDRWYVCEEHAEQVKRQAEDRADD